VLVLLAAAAVATAHFYWTGLRGGVAQVHEAVAVAQAQQQRLLERLKVAQAALAERAAAPAPMPADPPPAAQPATAAPAAPGGSAPTRSPASAPRPPTRAIAPPERRRLAVWIRALERNAARLPHAPGRGGAASAKQLLRDQLAIAAAAAAAGDPALLDAALFAAQRLAEAASAPPDGRAGDLAAQLRELRAGLREPVGVPGAGVPTPIQPLAPHAAAPAR
jgi:hypothetical protein